MYFEFQPVALQQQLKVELNQSEFEFGIQCEQEIEIKTYESIERSIYIKYRKSQIVKSKSKNSRTISIHMQGVLQTFRHIRLIIMFKNPKVKITITNLFRHGQKVPYLQTNYHRIQQKQLQMTSKYKQKISKQQVQISLLELDRVGQTLINQYNSYIQEGQLSNAQRLSVKRYGRMSSGQLNQVNIRQSLKQSSIMRDRISKINGFKSTLQQSLKKYQKLPQKLSQFNLTLQQTPKPIGLFNPLLLKHSQKYSNLLQTQIIKKISFDMLNSFFFKNKQSQTKLILNTIKGNLKIKIQSLNEFTSNFEEFCKIQLSKQMEMEVNQNKVKYVKEYSFHLVVLGVLNEIYFDSQEQFKGQNHMTQQSLLNYLQKRDISTLTFKHKKTLHITISSIIIKHLLSTLIIVAQDQPLLIDDYIQYIKYICEFSHQFLNVNQNLVKLLFLELLQNYIRSTQNNYIEEIYTLVEIQFSKKEKREKRKGEDLKNGYMYVQFQRRLVASIVTNVTEGIVKFYQLPVPLINFFSILACIEKISTQKFSAVQYFHQCIKRAGYGYIFWIDQDKKIIQPSIWQGQMRLKNLVQILQKFQFNKIISDHFMPTSSTMAHILGVGQNVILQKLKQQILEVLSKIIEKNMDLLVHEQGIDKQGYILKLGVQLAQLDIPSFTKRQFQNKYFKVLQIYLMNTQKQYNSLLDHSRKTQLWIMQQNNIATQNCIDFCSLLYKPFQFLLSTLKRLTQQNKTQFTTEFNQFIKNKLNNILKQQICKYIMFLQQSLRMYHSQQQQIYYKPKRGQNILPFTQEQNVKMVYQFKEVVRRFYNLNFLKEQLNQIIRDFLEDQIYEDIGSSIFNIQNLNRASNKYKEYKEILTNLKDIVQTIFAVQEKLIYKVSDISVYHFMRKIFYNLYFQQQKSTFEQFFSTKNDYKFSLITFINYQKYIEQIFSMIKKYVPEQISQKYYIRLISTFFKALKYQILNSTKMKLPKPKQDIVKYLDQDTTFVCTLLKQKYISANIIEEQLQKPLKKLFNTLLLNTKDLMQRFQTQSLKNNNKQCKYILIILYLRSNDQKAQQFFKKYKTIVFK